MPVQLEIDGRSLAAPSGRSLFDCAEEVGVRVATSCHKNGKCRECLVEVVGGMALLSAPSREEEHLTGSFRLACRARIQAEAGEIRCRTLRRGEMRVVAEGACVGLPAGGLDPAVRRDGEWVLRDGEPMARSRGPILGAALDVGTTTVVLRLVDLETGLVAGSAALENPQRFAGSDIMARIHYDSTHPGRLLQRTLIAYLAHCIADLGAAPDSIHEVVVTGNPTLRDLFFGLSVYTIGQRPYRSIVEQEVEEGKRTRTSIDMEARRLHLPVHPRARVYGMPLIRGHVGADAAACVLALGLPAEERTVLIMDIGTNTELVLGNREGLHVASCPAGPAFEGGEITCGMPGLEGAIESLRLDAGGTPHFATIGGGPPEGICGSGLVDLLGELLRTGRMDGFGRLTDESDRFVIDSARRIHLGEGDISRLAQAKGATVAGLRILLARAGLDLDDIDVFYLAGGFAKHLDLDAARRIGLIPDLPGEKVRQVGNAAIEGATMALLSISRRRELEEFVKRSVHVELETDDRFFDHFVEGCQFIPVRSVRI